MTVRLRRIRLLAVALLLLLAPLSALPYRLAHDGNLPDPLPTHWNGSGQVDGTTGLTTFTVLAVTVAGIGALIGLGLLTLRRHPPALVAGVVSAAWASWVMATAYAATVTAAAGSSSAEAVRLEAALVVAVVLVPTLVAVVTWFLIPLSPRGSAEVPTPSSPLEIRPGERATWVGQSSSPWLLIGALVLVVVAAGTVFILWPVALALGVGALAVAWAHRIIVRVDATDVTVAWGPTRWPRLRVPLDQVSAAHATTIEPLAWGGWGYRITPRGHAAVARRGPGLVLSRRERAPFAVTVDDPEGAADLVNAVVGRGSEVDRESR